MVSQKHRKATTHRMADTKRLVDFLFISLRIAAMYVRTYTLVFIYVYCRTAKHEEISSAVHQSEKKESAVLRYVHALYTHQAFPLIQQSILFCPERTYKRLQRYPGHKKELCRLYSIGKFFPVWERACVVPKVFHTKFN